jgi:uncharacterized protein (UPF0332 family)
MDPTVQEHLRIAQEFLAFAAWLRQSGRDDAVTVGWAITNIYYAALHTASAYVLARHGVRAESHADRDRWFRPNGFPELSRLDRADYFELKRQSEAQRYRGEQFTWADFERLRDRGEHFVAKFATRARTTTGGG